MPVPIRVTKIHHACLVIEDGCTRILVDPGRLGPRPGLDGVDAVLVTHGHFDHLDPHLVRETLDRGIPAWAPEDVIDELGAPPGLHPAVPGGSFGIGSLPVGIAGERHAEMHPTIPGPQNRAYLIGHRVFVTGDEHPAPPEAGVALATPVDAPWLRASDLIRYVRAVRPSLFIGVHDGLLNGDGLSVARHVTESLLRDGAARCVMPADGETIDVPGR